MFPNELLKGYQTLVIFIEKIKRLLYIYIKSITSPADILNRYKVRGLFLPVDRWYPRIYEIKTEIISKSRIISCASICSYENSSPKNVLYRHSIENLLIWFLFSVVYNTTVLGTYRRPVRAVRVFFIDWNQRPWTVMTIVSSYAAISGFLPARHTQYIDSEKLRFVKRAHVTRVLNCICC